MGLDMYLYKKTYVKNWEHMSSEEKHTIMIKKNNKTVKGIKPERIKYIVEEMGYWRKANAIHKWFVENVQEGNDDCQTYYVSYEDLKRLFDTVEKVLEASELIDGDVHNGTRWTPEGGKEEIIEKGKIIKDPTTAQKLLPTVQGFFFGGADYDQYYYRDLIETRDILQEALKDTDGDYEYTSSW